MSDLKKRLMRYPLWSIPVYLIIFFFIGIDGLKIYEIAGLIAISSVATFTTIHDKRERLKTKKPKPGSFNK